MRSNPVDYELMAPATLDAVLQVLAAEPGAHTLIAGGTELMVALAAGRLHARRLVSLHRVRELRFVHEEAGGVTIGAGATFTDLRRSAAIVERYPLLAAAASWTGSIANQNRGTLGGNLANASPAADSSPALLVYDASLTLLSTSGERRLPYVDFHLGYKQTALQSDELIFSIHLPPTDPAHTAYIRKVGTRSAMAISKVAFAGLGKLESGRVEHLRLAAASICDRPVRLYAAEQALAGRPLDAASIAQARAALATEIRPIDDIRSTAEYRSAVAGNLLGEFLGRLAVAHVDKA